MEQCPAEVKSGGCGSITTLGSEIAETRSCLIVSSNIVNDRRIGELSIERLEAVEQGLREVLEPD